jgi:Uma2 family endonuclease
MNSHVATSKSTPILFEPDIDYPDDKKEMQTKKHQRIFTDFTAILDDMFLTVTDANTGGDQAFYWNKGVVTDTIAPDAYLLRNSDKTMQDSIKLWEEKAKHKNFRIAFVMEIWSKSNPLSERHDKYHRYQELRASEYLEIDVKKNELLLHRLNLNQNYSLVEPNNKGRLYSEELDAELAFENDLVSFYRNGKKLLTTAEERTEKEKALKEIERLKVLLGKTDKA